MNIGINWHYYLHDEALFAVLYHLQKSVEHEFSVLRPGTCFRMELNCEDILSDIVKSFICAVIDICERWDRHPGIERIHIHSIAMVLR